MKVALIQSDIAWNDAAASLTLCKPFCDEALAQGAQLLVLPEMFTTGFSLTTGAHALESHEQGFAYLSQLARTRDVHCIASLPEQLSSGEVFNTSYLIGPSGVVGTYRKIHLFSFGDEQTKYTPGTSASTFAVMDLRITPFICYDLRFPQLFAETAEATDLYVVVANWPSPRREHWLTLLRARAIENQCFIVGVNRAGEGGGLTYSGDSVVFGPTGDSLGQLGSEPGVKVVEILASAVSSARSSFPTLRDRRPLVYSTILSDRAEIEHRK
jgi:predicted amidohydrolase